MKDLPHHVKQLNRKVIRSEKREEKQEEQSDALIKKEAKITPSEEQAKKKARLKKKKAKQTHVPHPQTPEERNMLMKKRVPIMRERSHDPKISNPWTSK